MIENTKEERQHQEVERSSGSAYSPISAMRRKEAAGLGGGMTQERPKPEPKAPGLE